MEICTVCNKNETARLMDLGGPEKVPVCTECLVSGRYKPETTNDIVCSVCGKECKSAFGLKSHMRTHK